MEFANLIEPASTLVDKIFCMKPGETIAIVKDNMVSPRIADAIAATARARGAEPITVTYQAPFTETASFPQRLRKNAYLSLSSWNPQGKYRISINQEPRPSVREPPKQVRELMKTVDAVFVYQESARPYDSVTDAIKSGARIATSLWMTEEAFARMLRIDYDAMVLLGKKLTNALSGSHKVRITTPAGTDLSFEHARERPFISDFWTGPCDTRGKLVSFALGMACTSPKEGTGNGVIAVDASVFKVDLPITEPLMLIVKNHRITEIQGGGRIGRALEQELKDAADPNAYNCPAEWGIGLNPGANMGDDVEAECCYGTAHIAIGRNDHIAGGAIRSSFHSDVLVWDPRIEVDGNVILDKGSFML